MITRKPRDPGSHAAALPVAAAFAWLAACVPALASSGPPRLLYAEPLAAEWEPLPGTRSALAGARGTLRFEAFGRAFAIALAPNERVGAPTAAGFVVQGGALADAPGSWARITRRGADLIGVVFDGQELFGIEPAADLAEFLDPAAGHPPGRNLVYRLSDLLVDPATLGCGLAARADSPATAAQAVRALVSEFSTPEMMAASGPARRLMLAPVADYEFATRYGSNAESEVFARLNIADGIFSEQVGIDIVSEPPTVFRSVMPPYPFTEDSAPALLRQVSEYRLVNHGEAGLTHLFTGKTLGDGLAGIAWLGAVCFPREGAGLSTSAGVTRAMSALIAAHEIGHNFGAPHDGEAGSACAATPTTYLMAARNGGSATFSACSLGRMALVIEQRAGSYPACLVPLTDFDVTVTAPAALTADPGEAIDIPLTVQNLGTQSASTVTLRLTTPAPLLVSGIDNASGICDYGPTEVTCDLASLAAGATWEVFVRASSDVAGTYPVTTTVSAAIDRQPGNNSSQLSMAVGDTAAGGGGGGGGGSPGILDLAGLALAGAWRLRSQRRGTGRRRVTRRSGLAASPSKSSDRQATRRPG